MTTGRLPGLQSLLRIPACRRLLSLDRQRQLWLERLPDSPLRDYYRVPFVPRRTPTTSVDFLALDFETTGFDATCDDIVSVGFAVISGHAVRLDRTCHILARPTGAMPESSAIVHGLMDDRLRDAADLADVLPQLLAALQGRVMLAHHAAIEYHFLDQSCRRTYGFPFCGPVVDTLELEYRLVRRRNSVPQPGSLRLANLREQYGLPRYRAHNALIDAIAAAEVFLAQLAWRYEGRTLLLEEIDSRV